MVKPTEVTNFERSERELEIFLLYCILVAGKSAEQTAAKLTKLLAQAPEGVSIFTWLNESHDLHNLLVANRIGQYGRIERAISGVAFLACCASHSLRTITVSSLEAVPGIGPKTARFFKLHTDPTFEGAVLDVHVLAWLREHHVDAPKATPSGAKYLALESIFLGMSAAYFPGLTPAERDLFIWTQQSGRLDPHQ
jgi:thermostable 8-oxoguanine DNA glycosylase